MSDIHITRVSTNLKSPDGGARSYDIGDKTLIKGRNGRGKSAIVQAIALAISGAAEEIGGRAVVSDPALLMTLAHGGGLDGAPLFARVNLSSGEHCQWEASRDGRRIKTPTHIRPSWVVPHSSKEHSPHFPLREVREVLTGSSKAARGRFLSWVCSDLEDATVVKALGGRADMFAKLSGEADTPVVDRLTASIKQADSLARKLRSDGRAQGDLRDKLLGEVGARPPESKVLAARDAVREAEELHEAALRSAGTAHVKARRKLLDDLLGTKRADEQRLRQQQKKLDLSLAALGEEDNGLEAKGSRGAIDALAWGIAEGADFCPICSSTIGRQHVQACHDFYVDKVGESAKVSKRRNDMVNELSRIVRDLGALVRDIAGHERELNDLPATSSTEGEDSSDVTREALAQARAELKSLNDSTTKWLSIDSAKKIAEENMAKAEDFSRYKKDAQDVVKRLLEERVDAYCERVSAFLPKAWEFGVMVSDQGRDVFYYGLYDGDKDARFLRVGLSEAQRVSVLCAMCAVLDEMQPVPLTVLAPEDRGWDSLTLGEVMTAFRAIPQKVLLTSTVMPPETHREGWTIIDLDALHGDAPRVAEVPELPLPSEDSVTSVPALLELPEALRARYAPMSGRTRGGKFRSLRTTLVKTIMADGFKAVRDAFQLYHANFQVDETLTIEEYTVSAANYLVPIEIS